MLEQGWPVGQLLVWMLWAVVAAVLDGLHPTVGLLSPMKEVGPALNVWFSWDPVFIQSSIWDRTSQLTSVPEP